MVQYFLTDKLQYKVSFKDSITPALSPIPLVKCSSSPSPSLKLSASVLQKRKKKKQEPQDPFKVSPTMA